MILLFQACLLVLIDRSVLNYLVQRKRVILFKPISYSWPENWEMVIKRFKLLFRNSLI
jgi:hypothetical protein